MGYSKQVMTKFIKKDVPCCYWINAVWLHSVSNISHHHAHINKCIMSSQYNDFSCVFSVLYKNHIDKTSYYGSSHFIWPTWILTCHNNSELFYQGWSLHSVAMYWYNGSTVTLGSNPVTQLCVSGTAAMSLICPSETSNRFTSMFQILFWILFWYQIIVAMNHCMCFIAYTQSQCLNLLQN